MIREPAHILVIDDNPGDIELIELGFSANEVPVRLDHAGDGIQAQAVLGALADAGDCPRLILLDLNMPRANGYEVLRFIEQRALCKNSAVVVMTTSDAPNDRDRCLRLGAREFVTKPASFDALLDLLKQLEPYLEVDPPMSAG